MRPWIRVSVTVVGVALSIAAAPAQPAAPLGARLTRYLDAIVPFSAGERRELAEGHAVTRLLDPDVVNEVAVAGAVWIAGSPSRYLQMVQDVETFEQGESFRLTKKISAPPRPSDFAPLQLPDEIDDLEDCRVGDCALKMPRAWIDELHRRVNFRERTAKIAADTLFREFAYRYVVEYLREGNAALATYVDKSRPMPVASEFRSMATGMPLLGRMPAVRDYLLQYPRAPLPGATEFLFWQDVKFGLKPTIRINHVVLTTHDGDPVVASKMLYATHYFWTALELRLLVAEPGRGPGFWLVTLSHSRTDGLTGLLGRLIRVRVRREAQQATRNILLRTKARIEAVAAP